MIYLIRHGLDDETHIGGWSNVGLTKKGKEQIKNSINYILDKHLQIESIYTSDITRARESAALIGEALGIKPIEDKRLRELNKGLLNGMDKNTAKEIFPQYMFNVNVHTRYPNGESMIDFYKRIKRDKDKILSHGKSLIVTHRGVINMLYYILNNRQPDMNKKQFGVTHGSIHAYDDKTNTIIKIY
ncbi:histidine phosphatase family protein [bacterium]|nr:histidine phosphatase family protein [bacterium]